MDIPANGLVLESNGLYVDENLHDSIYFYKEIWLWFINMIILNVKKFYKKFKIGKKSFMIYIL